VLLGIADRLGQREDLLGLRDAQSPDHPAFHTGCLGLQSHQVTGASFIQAPAVVD
jgi:hypothetical protein